MRPDAEKWKATENEIDDVLYSDGDIRTLLAVIETVARRRAVEELKALLPLVCECCAEEMESDGNFDHQRGRQVDDDEWEAEQVQCRASGIRQRIAEIEAEES